MTIALVNPNICDAPYVKVFDITVTEDEVINTDWAFSYGGVAMENFDSTPDVKIVRNATAAVVQGGEETISFYGVDRFGFHVQTTSVAPAGGVTQTFRCIFMSRQFGEL